MLRSVTLDDTHAIAIGAGILGTGGGGSTYLNRLRLENELRQRGGAVRVIQADDVPDDALVCAVGGMGAPTVSNEKLQAGHEIMTAVRALEDHLRKKIYAIVIGEIGGGNAIGPMVAALQCGLPVVDGDGMGRAFPELQMDTFMIYGVAPSPFVLADSHGNVSIFTRISSAKQAEDFARRLTIEMGGSRRACHAGDDRRRAQSHHHPRHGQPGKTHRRDRTRLPAPAALSRPLQWRNFATARFYSQARLLMWTAARCKALPAASS